MWIISNYLHTASLDALGKTTYVGTWRRRKFLITVESNRLTVLIRSVYVMVELTVDIQGTEVFWQAEYKRVLSSQHLWIHLQRFCGAKPKNNNSHSLMLKNTSRAVHWYVYLLHIFSLFVKHNDLVHAEHHTSTSDLPGQVCSKLSGLSVIQHRARQGHTHCVRPPWNDTGHMLSLYWELTDLKVIHEMTNLPFLLWFCSSFVLSAASCSFCFSSCLISLASFLCFLASFTVIKEQSVTAVRELDQDEMCTAKQEINS